MFSSLVPLALFHANLCEAQKETSEAIAKLQKAKEMLNTVLMVLLAFQHSNVYGTEHVCCCSRPDTSRRQRRRLPPCPLVIALVPLKCSSRNLQFPHRVPFTKEKMPWCPCPFKNKAYIVSAVNHGSTHFLHWVLALCLCEGTPI